MPFTQTCCVNAEPFFAEDGVFCLSRLPTCAGQTRSPAVFSMKPLFRRHARLWPGVIFFQNLVWRDMSQIFPPHNHPSKFHTRDAKTNGKAMQHKRCAAVKEDGNIAGNGDCAQN